MSRLILVVLLILLLQVAASDAAGSDRDGQVEHESHTSTNDDATDRHTRSSRVDVSQLPGITFTADELSREEQWTGMLPVNGGPADSAMSHPSSRQRSDTNPRPPGGSQLFYWLIKSRSYVDRHNTDADSTSDSPPLVIWLNGGPGCSSLGGLLEEHGPFFLERNPNTATTRQHNPHPYRLVHNRYSWSNYADVLYVDQPVGVGFSHLHDQRHLVRTEGRVAQDFYRALTYFLTRHHPQYRHRRIYLSGESYAAKYIPAIAGYILNQNRCLIKNRPALDDADWAHYNNTFYSLGLPTSCPDDESASAPSLHMNLSGLLIGNGDYSPLLQRFASRPITLSLGLMDVKQANQYSYLEEMCMADLRKAVVRRYAATRMHDR